VYSINTLCKTRTVLILIICRWLYSLNLAIDANFRLKNKARVVHNDPPLGDGWGHWVPQEPYQLYLQEYGHQAEVRAGLI
jgi:hypothetical protein